MLAFKRAEDAFAGEAQKAGFETEEDMQEYMKEIRKEVRGRWFADNAWVSLNVKSNIEFASRRCQIYSACWCR